MLTNFYLKTQILDLACGQLIFADYTIREITKKKNDVKPGLVFSFDGVEFTVDTRSIVDSHYWKCKYDRAKVIEDYIATYPEKTRENLREEIIKKDKERKLAQAKKKISAVVNIDAAFGGITKTKKGGNDATKKEQQQRAETNGRGKTAGEKGSKTPTPIGKESKKGSGSKGKSNHRRPNNRNDKRRRRNNRHQSGSRK